MWDSKENISHDILGKCSLIAEIMFSLAKWSGRPVSMCTTCALPGGRNLSPRDLTSNPTLNAAGKVSGDITRALSGPLP